VRLLGATHVISVHLPMQGGAAVPTNMFHVINRCFQIMHTRTESSWRQHSNLVIEPDVRGMEWDAFESAAQLMKAGEAAALEAVPRIRAWLPRSVEPPVSIGMGGAEKNLPVVPVSSAVRRDSKPA